MVLPRSTELSQNEASRKKAEVWSLVISLTWLGRFMRRFSGSQEKWRAEVNFRLLYQDERPREVMHVATIYSILTRF